MNRRKNDNRKNDNVLMKICFGRYVSEDEFEKWRKDYMARILSTR